MDSKKLNPIYKDCCGFTWFDLSMKEEMDLYLKKLDTNESNLGAHFGIAKKEHRDPIKAIWMPIQYDNPITDEKLGHILKTIRF
jgi:hypothetical protein